VLTTCAVIGHEPALVCRELCSSRYEGLGPVFRRELKACQVPLSLCADGVRLSLLGDATNVVQPLPLYGVVFAVFNCALCFHPSRLCRPGLCDAATPGAPTPVLMQERSRASASWLLVDTAKVTTRIRS
jgi:hypothetical protein